MIPLIKPFLDGLEAEEINKVLSSGFLTQGPKTAEFEKKVAEYIGSKYAFATSSCTTALHLALAVLDIQPGDEVLVADFTFPATANVVVQQGATPVLVDIDPNTFTMDPEDLRRKITSHTKAIIPVDAFGCSVDFDPILKIADEHGLPVIEDAATALGTTYHDRYCGNISTMGCFSFHPRKVITTGEGGMIITNDDRLAERIRLLRSHGGVRTGNWYQYEAAGFNYRLSDVLSAIGVIQMARLPGLIQRRQELAQMLTERLSNLPRIRTPKAPDWGNHIFQSYVIIVDDKLDQNKIIEDMRSRGVETTIGTYALHDQPFFQREYGYETGQLPNSHVAYIKSLTLPLYPQMDNSDLDSVANTLKIVISNN